MLKSSQKYELELVCEQITLAVLRPLMDLITWQTKFIFRWTVLTLVIIFWLNQRKKMEPLKNPFGNVTSCRENNPEEDSEKYKQDLTFFLMQIMYLSTIILNITLISGFSVCYFQFKYVQNYRYFSIYVLHFLKILFGTNLWENYSNYFWKLDIAGWKF